MPEPNPYEPPQSELSRVSSQTPRAAAWALIGRYIVPTLVGLQIAAVALAWLFDFMQAMAHSNYQRLQAIAEVCRFSVLGFWLLLMLIAFVRGSLKLLLFEIVVLGLILWWILPGIQ